MSDESTEQRYSRRNLLKSTAVGGTTVVLAGCSSNPSGETNGTSPTDSTPDDGTSGDGTPDDGMPDDGTSGDQELVDPRYDFIRGAQDTMPHLVWNPYSPVRYKYNGEGLAHFNQASGKWAPALAKDWTYNEDGSFTVTLADATWWNGDPVTAEDAVNTWKLDQLVYGSSSSLTGITAVDEKTFKYEIKGGVNPNLLEEAALRWQINIRGDLWQQFLDRLADVSGKEATKELRQDVVNYEPGEPYGTWIYKPTGRVTTQSYYLKKHEGHPHAEKLNIPKARWFNPTGASQTQQMMVSGKGDGTNAAGSQKIIEKYKESGISVLHSGLPIGVGVAMNQNKVKEFRDHRVRQAMGYITNPKQAEKAGVGAAPQGHIFPPTGMAGSMSVDYFFSGDTLSKFPQYKQNFEKAAALLTDAGFSKSGDSWKTPSGETFELEMLFGGPWKKGAQIVRTNLKRFGIDVTLRSVQSYFEDRNKPDWDISMQPWGSWRYFYHPIGGLMVDLLATVFPPQPINHWKTFCTPWEAREDGTITVPWPIGNEDGSTKKIDIQKKVETVLSTSDQQEAKQLCRELSWVYNQAMPIRPLTTNQASYFVATDQFNIPDADEWRMQASFTKFLSHGLIEAKTK